MPRLMLNFVLCHVFKVIAERIRLVFEREELHATMDKTLINPNPRLCINCTDRIFLRAGSDGGKHCTSYELQYFM